MCIPKRMLPTASCIWCWSCLFHLELSVNTAAFAKSAAMLGNSEDHTALSRALSQLAEVEEKIDQLHQEQAYADFYLFAELLSDYVRLLTAVKVFIFSHLNTKKGKITQTCVLWQDKWQVLVWSNALVHYFELFKFFLPPSVWGLWHKCASS